MVHGLEGGLGFEGVEGLGLAVASSEAECRVYFAGAGTLNPKP